MELTMLRGTSILRSTLGLDLNSEVTALEETV